MDKNNLPRPLAEPLAKDYETLSRDELQFQLQVFIAGLLENNFEKLCNMIYRHDVPENKFEDALEVGTIDEQAAKIAKLVLERELEKVASRRAYKKQKEQSSLNEKNT
ncbi:MAG: hypothetical protein L3J66_01385 [Bacteroidales bacterium]|nr:hypothetical protein [Bacteroidales bacterium]